MRWMLGFIGAILMIGIGVLPAAEGIDVPAKQVMVEVRIVEVNRTLVDEFGARMPFATVALTNQDTRAVTLVNSDAEGRIQTSLGPGRYTGRVFIEDRRVGPSWTAFDVLNGSFLTYGGQLSTQGQLLLFEALSNRELSKVLSAPRISTLSGQTAQIQTGVRVPTGNIADGDTFVEVAENGLRLSVTPQVTQDGRLILNLSPTNRDNLQAPINSAYLFGGGADGDGDGDGGN